MKKTVLTLIVSAAAAFGALAQGTVEFDNLTTGNPATSPKIFGVDGVTGLDDSYSAQLVYVPAAGSPVVLGAAATFFATSTGGNGFLNAGGVRTIAGVTGTANLMVQAWRTSDGTFAAAQSTPGAIWGQSASFVQNLGGPDPGGGPDLLPGKLVNLQSFNLSMNPVPEPSVVILGMAGAGLLFFRRKS